MARTKVDNKLNVVVGTKAQILNDATIPENSIIITTDEELTPSDIPNLDAAKITTGTFTDERIPQLAPSKITQTPTARFVSDTEKSTWNGKVTSNTTITGATKTKITYDSKGLVTSGADLVAADIPNLDAAKITTGTFTDERIPNLNASKINAGTFIEARIPALSPSKITQNASNRFVTDAEKTTWNAKLGEDSIIDGGDL